MKPGQKILLQLVDSHGVALAMPGVVVDVRFFTHGHFRYSFRFGPTDHQGRLRLDHEMIEARRASSATESLMDYNTPLTECDAMVRISIPSIEDLRRAHEIATRWAGRGRTPDYAEGWPTASNAKIRAEEFVADLSALESVVHIPCVVC